MTRSKSAQILKTRDDAAPISFDSENEADLAKPFRLIADSRCSWVKTGDAFGVDKLRPRIEPWLTALVQSEHLALLVGSGLTHALHWIATEQKLPGMNATPLSAFDIEVTAEAKRTSALAGRRDGNIEDQLRVANELSRGLDILAVSKSKTSTEAKQAETLRLEISRILESFARSILEGEANLVSAAASKREIAFNYLVSFLMSFASRSGTRERLQLFTTNYDRYIEAGADAAGLRLIDRFVGTLAPVFRASRLDVDLHYNPPGIRGEPRYLEGVARFTKLHGSVDWLDRAGVISRLGLPFGSLDIKPYLHAAGYLLTDAMHLMIYPNSAKDRETAAFPYVELFRDFASAVCRPNCTLFCYGYSFGDEHINRVIEDMLTIPSSHLVVMAHGDPLGRIDRMYQRLGRHAQVTLMIGNHLGDLKTVVDHYLPKPAIDRATFRMAELLKARWSRGASESDATEASPDKGGS